MKAPPVEELLAGLRAGNRAALGRAITLVESRLPAHEAEAARLLDAVLPFTGRSLRVGITGVPGVGKSSFIEAFGLRQVEAGRRVAVLAVDPSSSRTGGSILGDKTRMGRLSVHERAFIRPSPTAGTLGGVARRTREAILLCEAAGYDLVLVETVGVGQSELAVAGMTDVFLLLLLAGAGDELQGIKRGVMELADLLVVHKADGENRRAAEVAAQTLRGAVHLLHRSEDGGAPPVLLASSLSGEGLAEVEAALLEIQASHARGGEQARRRARQRLAWFEERLDEALRRRVEADPSLRAALAAARDAVAEGRRAAPGAVAEVLGA